MKKNALWICRAAALAFSLLAFAMARPAAADEVKLGFVDLQRALNETEDGKAAKRKLKSAFEQRQKDLDERQEALKKAKDDFDKQSTILKPDEAGRRRQDLEKQFVELQQTYLRLQKELAEMEAKHTRGIFDGMRRIIGDIAERENFTMIFERQESSIVWAKSHLDLTNEVIRRYNAGNDASKKKSK